MKTSMQYDSMETLITRLRAGRRQAGLSLVEVFVALLVLSVGLIALAKLQVDLVRGSGDSRSRTAAIALAEQKIEDLRTFATKTSALSWPVSATAPMAWSLIANNEGGRIAPGVIEQSGVQYTLSWTATTASTDSLTYQSFYKPVTVTVQWTNPDDTVQLNQFVRLQANIPDTPPGLTKLASVDLGDPVGPALLHTPGAQPEVIAVPIDIGGDRETHRETSKPLPTVKKTADSTMVTFDVVNYNADTLAIQRREEFVTLSCKCTFDGTGDGRTPAKVILVGNLLRDQPGKMITTEITTGKTIGRPAGQQPDLCNICCRDHHDYSDSDGDYFYNSDNPDHQHFLKTALDTPVTSGNYDEACRMKRINGVFQVFEDWNLKTLTVMPKADLEVGATKATEYITAVQNFVRDYAEAAAVAVDGGTPTLPTTLAFSPSAVELDPNAKQLLARAIYIDNMPDNLLKKIDDILSDADTSNDLSVLSLVPFYEIHLTKLADWISRDKTKVKVTSNAIPDQNVVDDGTAEGGVYSRGLAQPQTGATTGDTLIIATARNHNTGITNTLPINTTEDEGHPISEPVTPGPYYYSATDPEVSPADHKDGSITVSVGGGISISGSFQKAFGSPKSPQANKIGPPTGTISGAACECRTSAGDPSTTVCEAYSCTVPENWPGSITFSSTRDYSFCLNDDGSVGIPCIALPSDTWNPNVGTTSIARDIYVWDPQ